MTDRRTLLLIDNDSSHAAIFRTALHDASEGAFQHEWVMTLAEGIERLRAKGIWAIFINLSLPDSQGIETFNRLSLAAPGIPTLVLAGAGENDIALDALRSGAKDYLLENHLDSYSFVRAIRNMVEREIAKKIWYTEKERAQATRHSVGDTAISREIEVNITYLNDVANKMTWIMKDIEEHVLLIAASVLAARKLVSALNSKPYPVRDAALSYAIRDAEDVLHRIKMHHNV